MSKIKLLTIAVIGLLLVNLGILAFLFLQRPGPLPGNPEGRREEPREIIIRRLKLDHEQVSRYEELIMAHRDGISGVDRQIRDSKNRLYATLAVANPAGKDSLIERINQLQKEVENIHYDHFAAIKGLLRPGQIPDFDKLTGELARFFAAARPGPPPR